MASIAGDFGTAVGVLAGMIAIAGFLGHAEPVLRGGSEREVQKATVVGGLVGCCFGAFVVVLSAWAG
jgi:hypothetical protein